MNRKPLTLWQTLQRTPPFVCLAMAVRRDRKKGVAHRSVSELIERSGIKRRTLLALAYRREWPSVIKTVSDFADACGVNLLARDPRKPYRKLANSQSMERLLTPRQRRSMLSLAKAQEPDHKSATKMLTINGETHLFLEWAKRIGITVSGLRHRLNQGLTGDELCKPSQRNQAKGKQ